MPVQRTRRPPISVLQDDAPAKLASLWALRILINLGQLSEIFDSDGELQNKQLLTDPKMVEFLGMTHEPAFRVDEFGECEYSGDAPVKRVFYNKLNARLRTLEREAPRIGLPVVLAANLEQVAKLVNLGPAERTLLAFTVILKTTDELRDIADLLSDLSLVRTYRALARILKLEETEVRAALAKKSALAQSGLLRLDPLRHLPLNEKLDLLSDSFAERMGTEETPPLDLLRDTIALAAPPTLTETDFQHVASDLQLAKLHLINGIRKGRMGINILLHGPSGTGKTEMARNLAAAAGVDLFEVTSEDEDGDAIDGNARMRAYRAAQVLLAQRSAILLFDEAEDIFGQGGDFLSLFTYKGGEAQRRKAWINKMLESNRAPTLWLTNSISGIDPAFIRRFDLVIEMPIPPKRQRERIVGQHADGLLPKELVSRLAQSEHLSPAVAARAMSVIRNVREDIAESDIPQLLERVIDGTLRAQGWPCISSSSGLPALYDPALVNASTNLARLTEGLTRVQHGRLCLYGPPGTGKTAYVRWLAEQSGRPLLVKRASDLIDMWVGSSERNIAAAFAEATREEAILLMDEADSFLQDRRRAGHSWEITQVNEMLTQMEHYQGLFVASTNLLDELDQATLRRFDLKLKFDYLQPEQAWNLFRRHCRQFGIAEPAGEMATHLSRLTVLTPGDFAACARRHEFQPFSDAKALLAALGEECSLKEAGKAGRLGFLA